MSLQISHIYGSQKKSFRKILENQDRNTYVLSLNGINIGILTYKTILQNEYNAYIYDYIKQYDIKDVFLRGRYIELKSLFLYDKDFMGKGYVYALLHKLVSECSSNPSLSKADGIFVSVSSGKADKSLAMFKKLWFWELWQENGKYSQWDEEVMLFYSFNKNINENSRI